MYVTPIKFFYHVAILLLIVLIWIGAWNILESLKYQIFGDAFIGNFLYFIVGIIGIYLLTLRVPLSDVIQF